MPDTRTKSWAFIVYPDSAPEDWLAQLRDLHTPGFVSLHDQDDGKPHYHVMLLFASKKSYEQVKCIADMCCAPRPEPVHDTRAYARYLCHLDEDDKAKYNPSDVVCLGGADYFAKIETSIDTDTALAEMMEWCIDQGCYSFFRLSNYAAAERPDWFSVMTSRRTVFLKAWLQSYQWELQTMGDDQYE